MTLTEHLQEIEDRVSDIHTMPNNGRHDCSVNCFCVPELNYQDDVTKIRVFLHKSDEELNQ